MFKTLAGTVMVFAGEALAHPGHGSPEIHLHGWEYVLLVAVAACVAYYLAKR